MLTKYSIASHLIHSRMQLIRHRFTPRLCLDGLFQTYYSEFLEKAVSSVKRDHGIECEKRDVSGAIELILESFRCDGADKYYVVIEHDYQNNTSRPVTSTDGGHTVVPASQADRWTYHEAQAVKNDIMAVWRNKKHLSLDFRWHLPPVGTME